MENQEEFHNLKLNDIYARIGHKINARKNKKGEYVKVDIATALHVNPQDISNWAFRERFPWPELFLFSLENKISFGWLLTGKKDDNKNCDVGCDEHIMELCKKVKDVVESGTHWGASLEANIHSFKAGLDGDKEREEIKKDMNELKKSTAGLSSERPKKDIGKKRAM